MRKLFILTFAALAISSSAMAQEQRSHTNVNNNRNEQDNRVFDVVEQQPSFPGGPSALNNWIRENIKYPADAAKNEIEGLVTVSFIVEKDGSISNVKVVYPTDPSLDKEAVRLVAMMPKWRPGRQNGQPARVKYFVPITFKLH